MVCVDDDCSMCVAPQEKEMEKQKILYQQARLHARGAAEMVLQMMGASKGNDKLIVPQLNILQFKLHYSVTFLLFYKLADR